MDYIAEQQSAVKRHQVQHEGYEQEALFRWATFSYGKYPDLKHLFHIPNGGKRNKAEAVHFMLQGVKAGVPDLFLPVARGKYHGLFIELKYGKNKASDNQNIWIANLREQGYAAEICYGWEPASELITKYLEMKE